MNKFKKLIMSLMALNVMLSIVPIKKINAEPFDNYEGNPGAVDDDILNPPADLEPEPEPDPGTYYPSNPGDNTSTPPVTTPEPQPAPIQTQESVEEMTEEITESSEETSQMDVTQLFVGLAENPAVEQAYTDFQYVTTNYIFEDANALEGQGAASTIDTVQTSFEEYLNGLSANDEFEIETKPEIIELDGNKSLNYHYFYKGEKGEPEKSIATLQLVFNQENLKAASFINHAPIITNQLDAASIELLNNAEMTFEDLLSRQLTVEGAVYSMNSGQVINTIIFSGEKDTQKKHEFVEMSSDSLEYIATSQAKDGHGLLKDVCNYVFDKEMNPVAMEEESSKKVSSSVEESSVEDSTETLDNSTESMEEETEVETTEATIELESTIEELSEENLTNIQGTIIDQIPVDFEYDSAKVIGTGKLRDANNKLFEHIKAGSEISLTQLTEIYGQPTVETTEGSFETRKYLSIADDKVTIVEILVDSATQSIKDIKIDNRTDLLNQAFPFKVDDLYKIVEKNDQILPSMNKMIGQPTIMEYMPETKQIRYVWTSFVDKAIQNIEVFENLSDGSFELLYYEPEK